MLELLPQPAFYVVDGVITQVNQGAYSYLLHVGDDIRPLLYLGIDEYRDFQSGCIFLTLAFDQQKVEATVIALEDRHLFVLMQESALAELRTLALAAKELRKPLTGMLSTVGQFIPDDVDQSQLAQFNRRTHQLMRIISNMSDAAYYCQSSTQRMEQVQLCSFLEELLNKGREQLLHADIHLHYHLPSSAICTLVDTEKLERAVYNLISNAAKHTPPGGDIHVELVQKNRLYLSVTDMGFGADPHAFNAYYHYLRTPSIADNSDGIGLGMVLVRATAALHNGTVLIDRPDGVGTRVTMTLALTHGKGTIIRSPIFFPDYTGEHDHALQELADVLPTELYLYEKFF